MSMRVATFFDSVARTLAIALVLALLATGVLWFVLQRGTERTITAYFTSTVGLYTQNNVTIQGIPVGQVEDIVPQGDLVRVRFTVDDEAPVPADVKAVIVAPTLVSDRNIQLGPIDSPAPPLRDGAIIGPDRTAIPVELDRVYKSLDTIATSLGPNGANQAGALNQLLRSSSGALGGNGEAIKRTITELGGAVGTLSDNRDNLFATVDNLGQFTNTLARNDGQVRDLNNQLQDISAFLAAQRGDLSTVLRTLPPALNDVARFVADNRDILRTDVGRLRVITDILVRQRAALTEFADVAPLALGNLTNTYNARSGTLDVRPVLAPDFLNAGLDPRALLCGLLTPGGVGGVPGLPAVLPAGTPVEAATTLAQARTVCTQLTDPNSLVSALAPFQTLAKQLGAAPSLNALTARIPGTATPTPGSADTGAGATRPPAGQDDAVTAGPGGILGFNQTIGGTR